ncbi:hypothetical protein ACFVAJ_17120 [Agromyces sp. NPDC057679]|uniref:hypothetical protein n=1 Tax=Agromyces sp. NPDC057679 TaxID=3346207 RepID=UPI00366CB2AE
MTEPTHDDGRHDRSWHQHRLLKVAGKDLQPGDIFECDGMVVLSVTPVEGDTGDVRVRYENDGVQASYDTSATLKHLIRRP